MSVLGRCLIPDVDVNASSPLGSWDTEVVRRYIPRHRDLSWDGCHILSEDNSSQPCEAWVYDDTYYTSSRAIEWDLVCGRRWMGAVAKAAYMFGVFAGAVSLGSMADK